MDISERRKILNKLLGDFMSESSQAFLSISNQLKLIPQTDELKKKVDRVFKRLIEFNRNIGNETNENYNQYDSLLHKYDKLIVENKRLETLYLSGILFQSEIEMKNLLEKAIDTIISELKADEGFIVLTNDQNEIDSIVSKNINIEGKSIAEQLCIKVINNAAANLKPIGVNDIKSQNEFSRKSSVLSLGLTSEMCVPLISQDSVLGAVYINRRDKENDFSEEDLIFLVSFAKQVVKGIELSLEVKALESKHELDYRIEFQELRSNFKCEYIIGSSLKLFNIIKIASKVADTDASVLILGENGTGKDLLAKALHENSKRADKPFIAVNCGAIPSDLLESELFGYESGAFTGAVKSKPGKLEMGHGGTVFLDEIAEMSINLQAKLLRIIQTKEIERLGSVSPRKIDVRFIAATNKDIGDLISKNNFREDLYYRLKVFEIKLPALRERKEDIESLVEFFLKRYSKDGDKLIAQPEVYEILESYDWPGNIRELENVIQRSAILCKGNVITIDDLPIELIDKENEITRIHEQKTLLEAETEFRKMYIMRTLRKVSSKAEAAQILGVNRTHLYKLINQLGIEDK